MNPQHWGWGRYIFSVEVAEWKELTGLEAEDDEYASDDVTGS